MEILVHGAICMFQSRRNLVGSYLKFQGQVVEKSNLVKKDYSYLILNANYINFEDQQNTYL